MVHVAEGLESLGVKPGDSVACIGHTACLNNHYWRGWPAWRILTEIYDPRNSGLSLPRRSAQPG